MNDPNAPASFKTDDLRVGEAQERWGASGDLGAGGGVSLAGGKVPLGRSYSLFLISFSSLRMRDDSCSGVGARRDRELEPSGPEGGAGSLWRKRSSMLLCSLLFSP